MLFPMRWKRALPWLALRSALCLVVPILAYSCEEEMLNHEAEIVQIHFLKQVGQDTVQLVSDTIRPMTTTLSLQVSHAADLQRLIPVFELSDGAQADCKPGRAYDFSQPFSITITAANGRNQRTYRFEITKLPAPPIIEPVVPDLGSETTLSNFTLQGVEALVTVKATRIYVVVPDSTDLTALVPQFDLANGATVDYEPGTPYDFREPLYLRVTSEDGFNVTTYRIFVRYPDPILSAEAQVLSFRFHQSEQDAEIDGARIYATVRPGSDLSKLVPTFSISEGAKASIAQHKPADFSQPVKLEVYSQDGSAKSTYTVHAEVRMSSHLSLKELLVLPMGEASMHDDSKYVWLVDPETDISNLRTYIRLGDGCKANIDNGAYVDYSKPKQLIITSEDGFSQRTYILEMRRVPGKAPDEKGIIEEWAFTNATAKVIIYRNEIHCCVPAGTNRAKLIPSFTIRENSKWINLSKGFLKRGDNNNLEVVSGKTTLDFTKPRTFEVWRKNPWIWELAPRSRYKVYVTEEAPSSGGAKLISVTLRGIQANAKIRGGRVDLDVPSGTDLRHLIPEFRVSANATTSIASGATVDFTQPVQLIVKSQGGNAQRVYTIVVTPRLSDQAAVTQFSFLELASKPSIQGARIQAFAGSEIDITRLTPRVEVSRGAACTLPQEGAMDFSQPVFFDVVSEDGCITRRYTVVVEQRLNGEAELLAFRFAELDSPCQIDGSRVLMPDLPSGIDPSALTPLYTISSGATCTLAHGVKADFSQPVRFTITSEDGAMTKSYTVRRTQPSVRFDFEQWIKIGSGATAYEHPADGWSSGNAGTAIAMGFFGRPERFPVRRSTESHSGTGAAVITTELLNVDGNSIAAGALWLGGFKGDNVRKDPLSGPQFGMAWPGGLPATLKGWYKYKPGAQMVNKAGTTIEGIDEPDIYAVLFHGPRLDGHSIASSPNIVAIARLTDLSSKGEYTPFEVEFQEVNGGVQPGKPIQYTIVLSSSRQGAHFIGAVGSELIVDELEITLK